MSRLRSNSSLEAHSLHGLMICTTHYLLFIKALILFHVLPQIGVVERGERDDGKTDYGGVDVEMVYYVIADNGGTD